ncbi:MAG: dTDP-4-dehydrorhamnose reductase [Proteobacteria bacterium]|nr:dTDP-4-dehydrorhamnose reductase [Pseudomonadota bacterium]
MGGARPIVVLGARGLVGTALMKALARKSPLALNRSECDLTNADQILKVMDRLRPRMFFNAAAFTDVDACETRPGEAYRINALGPGYLAQAAREIGCLLVHLSTDFVFDGRIDRPYTEEDRPAPLSVYGRTKLAGEEAVRDAGGDWLVVRTAWVFGGRGRGFPWRILDLAREGRSLSVVDDQWGCPTSASDLAKGLTALAEVGARGLVHLANDGRTTWWELARRTLDLAGLAGTPVERISSRDLGRPAPRPVFSVLDTSRYSRLTGSRPRPWEIALAEAIANTGPS